MQTAKGPGDNGIWRIARLEVATEGFIKPQSTPQ